MRAPRSPCAFRTRCLGSRPARGLIPRRIVLGSWLTGFIALGQLGPARIRDAVLPGPCCGTDSPCLEDQIQVFQPADGYRGLVEPGPRRGQDLKTVQACRREPVHQSIRIGAPTRDSPVYLAIDISSRRRPQNESTVTKAIPLSSVESGSPMSRSLFSANQSPIAVPAVRARATIAQ